MSGFLVPQRMSTAPILREGFRPADVLDAGKGEVCEPGVGRVKRHPLANFLGRRNRSLLGWRMRNFFFGLSVALVCPVVLAQAAPVADRVTQQNALFEEYYQAGLKRSPERATSLGDYRYNNLLSQRSLKAIAEEHAEADAFLARLEKISIM